MSACCVLQRLVEMTHCLFICSFESSFNALTVPQLFRAGFFPVSLFVTGLKLRECSECTLSRWQMSVFRASTRVEAGDGPCEDALCCSRMFGLWRFSQEQLCQQQLDWWKTDVLARPINCPIFGHFEIINILASSMPGCQLLLQKAICWQCVYK